MQKPEINNLSRSESETLKPQVELNDSITPNTSSNKVSADVEDPKDADVLDKAVKADEKEDKVEDDKEDRKDVENLNKAIKEDVKEDKEEKIVENEKDKKKNKKNNKKEKKEKKPSKKEKKNSKKNSKAKKPTKDNKEKENKQAIKEDKEINAAEKKLNKKETKSPKDMNALLKETLHEDVDEIEKLKAKVSNLLKMNKYLLGEMEKGKKIKNMKREASDGLVELIQKSESPINFMQKKIIKTQDIVQEKIREKETELNNEHQLLLKNLDNLVEKVQRADKSLKILQQDPSISSGEIKKQYETDKLNVKENIQNDGITYVNNVHTEELDLGNLKIDFEKLMFNNPDSEIVVGSNILSLKELSENLDLMDKLNARCGVNMEKCVIYNENIFEKEIANENKIIDGVKYLRKETQRLSREKRR